jgi:hypothetical protein
VRKLADTVKASVPPYVDGHAIEQREAIMDGKNNNLRYRIIGGVALTAVGRRRFQVSFR